MTDSDSVKNRNKQGHINHRNSVLLMMKITIGIIGIVMMIIVMKIMMV